MITIKGNTMRGKKLIERGSHYDGYFLYQVYDSYSIAKENAWERCFDMYLKENGTDFSIISHNNFGFSVSWITEQGMRIETPRNSYLVTFEYEKNNR